MTSPLRLYFVAGFLIITGCLFGSCSSVDICSAERCSASDQLCQFIWDNRADMIENIRHRLKRRPHKRFLRFKSPVYYPDTEGKWKQAKDEFETWVSVAYTHEYMLHFPHNFNVLSLGTMGIITDEFWGPDAKWDISGSCNKACAELKKPRCSLSRRDIQEFVANVTEKGKQDWDYICFQLDYDVNDVVRNPNTAIPDIFYYWRFWRQLITKRPYLVKGFSKNDFVHYNCYDKEGRLHEKKLLRKYFLIFIIAVILWLYSPLLVHYFPSSQPPAMNYPAGLNPKDFCPTFRSPVYFGGFLRCILCFHMEDSKGINLKSRTRRFLFLTFFLMISFRLWYTSYQIFLSFLVAALVPEFFSVYLEDELPTHFLWWWKYPEGVFRENARKKEYQFLAHCMSERIYLISDGRFWEMLVEKSLKVPPTFFAKTWAELYQSHPLIEIIVSVFLCVVTFAICAVIAIFYHLVPAFYFYKVLFLAIGTLMMNNIQQAWHKQWAWRRYNAFLTALCFLHGVILAAFLVYSIVAAMFCCYLLAEVTLFTYIGAVLVPTMAFKYLSLVGAVSIALNKINKDLRENYDRIRDHVVKILENEKHLTRLNSDCTTTNPEAFERSAPTNDALLTIQLKKKKDPQSSKVVLYSDHFATYLSRSLLDFCIEFCDPLRRQMMFIIVEVFLMAFYVVIAMWMKNVFHKESEVSSIFSIAQNIGVDFVPNLLQFVAHKSHFGKKDDVLLSPL
ncbi:PREDICTED: uncharacterized protein LOC107330252 [Acropora digitifera]|uniref:uncharacterized protein LOC107330252 n=1 Tax=Acropora digitifera TaxID=70779 RepID=UPI00077A3F4A|nr:PREDICTED: uncharacterized protein LOC107330252 [Acropora digitifera]